MRQRPPLRPALSTRMRATSVIVAIIKPVCTIHDADVVSTSVAGIWCSWKSPSASEPDAVDIFASAEGFFR